MWLLNKMKIWSWNLHHYIFGRSFTIIHHLVALFQIDKKGLMMITITGIVYGRLEEFWDITPKFDEELLELTENLDMLVLILYAYISIDRTRIILVFNTFFGEIDWLMQSYITMQISYENAAQLDNQIVSLVILTLGLFIITIN